MATATDSKIINRLSEMEKEEGGLPLLLKFYRQLILVQITARKQTGTPKIVLTAKDTQERIQQGLPLLSFDDLNIDWPTVQDLFVKIVDVFSDYPGLFGKIPEKLKKQEAGRLLTRKATEAWFNNEELPAGMLDGTSATIMRAIIQSTLRPLLTAYAETLSTSVDQERWRRRYCPICGGSPDLAFLDKERGSRWLLCSRCDFEWLSQRLQCPYCGTQDQNALAFFSDERELYRIHVCERCKCYLKTIDLRKANSEVLMPLERLLTTDMDRQAGAEGYKLPA